MCWSAAESAKTKLQHSSGNPREEEPHSPTPFEFKSPKPMISQNPLASHMTRLSSGGGGKDTSPLSGTLAGAQCSGEGWVRGRASIQSALLCFFAQCLLRPKKMLGLLIISILNSLFKTGHVKVRGYDINHTDSSFPPVELVAALVLLQMDHL